MGAAFFCCSAGVTQSGTGPGYSMQPRGGITMKMRGGGFWRWPAHNKIAAINGGSTAWKLCSRLSAGPWENYAASSSSNPHAFSSDDGTYFSSLFCRTHSRSRSELKYCSGLSPSISTTFSNDVPLSTPHLQAHKLTLPNSVWVVN